MKLINIPFRTEIATDLDNSNETIIFTTESLELLQRCKQRAHVVLQSCLDVEEWIKDLIFILLFDKDCNNKYFIKGVFLDSDFCMFNSKIKILNSTLKYFKLLTGKKRNQIENILPKINKLRNNFAHGKIFLKNSIPTISYFQGTLLEDKMDEEYWANVEKILNESHALMKEVEKFIIKE